MTITLDGTTGITTPTTSTTGEFVTSVTGFKNRIINGAMVIDQRNAGASGTATSFPVDRWSFAASLTTKGTWQQNAGSVTPPVGFANYLGFTSNSAYAISATDYFTFQQRIEGFNFYDLAFGTANAATVTLSFRVYSSLTGTFGGSFSNGAGTRSYPFTYTISSANTWTQISVTIAGDTGGTWIGATNGNAAAITFSLGTGTTYSGTAGAWSSNLYLSATGATSVVGTNGATFYITGVQLEKGSTATSFDYRSYGTELALCQRYYQATGNVSVSAYSTTGVIGFILPVTMRAAPTVTFSYAGTTNNTYRIDTGAQQTLTSPTVINTNNSINSMYAFTPAAWAGTPGIGFNISWFLSAEL